jgi:hypothetical protein
MRKLEQTPQIKLGGVHIQCIQSCFTNGGETMKQPLPVVGISARTESEHDGPIPLVL